MTLFDSSQVFLAISAWLELDMIPLVSVGGLRVLGQISNLAAQKPREPHKSQLNLFAFCNFFNLRKVIKME